MNEVDEVLLYLVLPAKLGWSVNLGADTIAVFETPSEARDEANRLVAESAARGQPASMFDHSD